MPFALTIGQATFAAKHTSLGVLQNIIPVQLLEGFYMRLKEQVFCTDEECCPKQLAGCRSMAVCPMPRAPRALADTSSRRPCQHYVAASTRTCLGRGSKETRLQHCRQCPQLSARKRRGSWRNPTSCTRVHQQIPFGERYFTLSQPHSG